MRKTKDPKFYFILLTNLDKFMIVVRLKNPKNAAGFNNSSPKGISRMIELGTDKLKKNSSILLGMKHKFYRKPL